MDADQQIEAFGQLEQGPVVINQATDMLFAVDIEESFTPGGPLEVTDGDAVIPVTNKLARIFRRKGKSIDNHDGKPAGHVSFASTHPGRQPLEQIGLEYARITLDSGKVTTKLVGPCDLELAQSKPEEGDTIRIVQTLWPDHGDDETHPDLDMGDVETVIIKGNNPEIDSYSAVKENDGVTQTGLVQELREKGINRLFLTGLATNFCVGWTALDLAAEGFEVVMVADGVRAISGLPADHPCNLDHMIGKMRAAGVKFVTSDQIEAPAPGKRPAPRNPKSAQFRAGGPVGGPR